MRPPVRTILVELVPILRGDRSGDIIHSLQEINRQSTRDMPRNMAVHQPRTGVIGVEGDQEPPTGGEHSYIPAARVVPAQTAVIGCRVEFEARLVARWRVGRTAYDEEVMTVEMEGVLMRRVSFEGKERGEG